MRKDAPNLVYVALATIVLSVVAIPLAAAIAVYPSGESFPTIQEAIDASAEGSTILIPEGSYRESLFVDKQMTIISYGFISFSPLDPEQSAVSITADGIALVDFHIAHASVGVRVAGSSFRMESCLIDDVEMGIEITAVEGDGVSLYECSFTPKGIGSSWRGAGDW